MEDFLRPEAVVLALAAAIAVLAVLWPVTPGGEP